MWTLYAFFRHDTMKPFYIGITKDFERRARQHVVNVTTARGYYCKELTDKGVTYSMEPVKLFRTQAAAENAERELIDRLDGLLNRTYRYHTPRRFVEPYQQARNMVVSFSMPIEVLKQCDHLAAEAGKSFYEWAGEILSSAAKKRNF